MIIKNLTPHKIKIFKKDWTEIEFESNWILRLKEEREEVWEINWITIWTTKYKDWYLEIDWLKSKVKKMKENVIYIVSILWCQWFKERSDFYIVSNTVRDENWRIIWCKSLSQNPYYQEN